MTIRFACAAFLIVLVLMALPVWAQTPSIANGGVLQASDYSANISPGAMVAVFGSNLAPATLKADTLPLPTVLSNVSVDIVTSSATFSAPIYFISAGQINVQMPFEVPPGTVNVRVRTSAGTSGAMAVTILAAGPGLFTRNALGTGDAFVYHADYSAVTADKPAVAGEVVFLYASGLGAVSPAISAGRAAGDSAAGGPLNYTTNTVTVTVGGTASPHVWFAGLAPGMAGVYQVNFEIPANVQAGPYLLAVQAGGKNSAAGVSVYAGAPAVKLYDNTNVAGCSTTATSLIHLDKPAHISTVDVWYHWSTGETGVTYKLTGAAGDVASGSMQRAACDPTQTSWCYAEALPHADLATGDYTLTMGRSQMCANSGSANQGFAVLYGIWKNTGWTDVASSTVGAAGGTVSGGGFSLTVPAGAFGASTTLAVQKSTLTSPATSPTAPYMLSGLPSTWSKPLTVSLDVSNPVAVQNLSFLLLGGDSAQQLGPEFIHATVAGGKLTATIPASPAAGSAAHAAVRAEANDIASAPIPIGSMSGLQQLTSPVSTRFNLYFAGDAISSAANNSQIRSTIWDVLDQTYGILGSGPYATNLGLDWSKRKTFPIDVFVYAFNTDSWVTQPDTETWGFSSQIYYDRQNQQLELNSRKMVTSQFVTVAENLESVKITAGHELFHILQNLYDPRSDIMLGRGPGPWFWFEEAASTWIEKRIANNPATFIPSGAQENFNFLHLHSLEYLPGNKFLVEQHGYGASMYLEHASTIGFGYLGAVMKHMPDSTVTPAQAFVLEDRARNASITDTWLAFCDKFLGQRVYSGLTYPTPTLLDSLTQSRRAVISPKVATGVTSASFSTVRPSLSAEFYRLDFADTSTWTTATSMTIKMSSGHPAFTPALVYHYSKNRNLWEALGQTTDTKFTVTVSHIENYTPNSDFLYIMLVNEVAVEPFTDSESISLDVTVDTPLSILPWLQVSKGFIANFSGIHQCQSADPGASGTISRCGSSYMVAGTDYKADESSHSLSSANLVPAWNGTDFAVNVTNIPISIYQFDTAAVYAVGTFSGDGRTLKTATVSIVMSATFPNKTMEVKKLTYTITNVSTNQTPGTATPSLQFTVPATDDALSHVSGVTWYDLTYNTNADVVSGWKYNSTTSTAGTPASLTVTFYK